MPSKWLTDFLYFLYFLFWCTSEKNEVTTFFNDLGVFLQGPAHKPLPSPADTPLPLTQTHFYPSPKALASVQTTGAPAQKKKTKVSGCFAYTYIFLSSLACVQDQKNVWKD